MATPLKAGDISAATDILSVANNTQVTEFDIVLFNDSNSDTTVSLFHKRGGVSTKFVQYDLNSKKDFIYRLEQVFDEGDALVLNPGGNAVHYLVTINEVQK